MYVISMFVQCINVRKCTAYYVLCMYLLQWEPEKSGIGSRLVNSSLNSS